jgi:hypothetical protein
MARTIESPPPRDWLGSVRELQRVSELALRSDAGLDLYVHGERGERVRSMISDSLQFLDLVLRDIDAVRRAAPPSVTAGPRNYRVHDVPLLKARDGRRETLRKEIKRLQGRINARRDALDRYVRQSCDLDTSEARASLRLVRYLGDKYLQTAMRTLDTYKHLRRGVSLGSESPA